MSIDAMELVRLENVHKTYHLGEIDAPVLRGVSLAIARGELVALMGASGSGKTTLMNILGCLDRPTSGRHWLDGREMSAASAGERALARNAKIGFVFQNFNLLPRTSALENVLLPLEYARGDSVERGCAHAVQLLERLGLAAHTRNEPSQLSGGQQQRVAIARALVNDPLLLLAVEPTGALDSRTGDETLQLFQELNREQGITVVIVTHDAHVAGYADRVVHIRDGLIEEGDEGLVAVGAELREAPAR
jgi:ABC-type lipoprotein export system ATPase subunit